MVKIFSRSLLLKRIVLFAGLVVLISSCRSYRSNIMFTTKEDVIPGNVAAAVYEAERNYVIKKNDFLNVEVYTNAGERIIDPDFELLKETGIQTNQQLNRPNPNYLVQQDGMVKLPMVGKVSLEGMTLQQSDVFLQEQYSQFYEDPFVITRYVNKRVIVLGAIESTVIPLANENMSLVEVLALAGGLDVDSRAHNIRIIRGALDNPEVYVVDLSTIEGMSKTIKKVLPGDIIYVEPIRRTFTEITRDIAPIVSLIASSVALIVSIQVLTKE